MKGMLPPPSPPQLLAQTSTSLCYLIPGNAARCCLCGWCDNEWCTAQGWTELHCIVLHWSRARKIPIIYESQWLRLGESVEWQSLWMLCLRGCVSCLEHAKRHWLLLNQDFLLNSLQQLSRVCLKPPGRDQGLFLTEQLRPPCRKCLNTEDETVWGGKGCLGGGWKWSSSPTRGTPGTDQV